MLLEKEGLVEMPPRRRPRVTDLTIKEIRDIYRVRANLLELIAGDIARDVSPSEIETLQPMLRAMEEATELATSTHFFGRMWTSTSATPNLAATAPSRKSSIPCCFARYG